MQRRPLPCFAGIPQLQITDEPLKLKRKQRIKEEKPKQRKRKRRIRQTQDIEQEQEPDPAISLAQPTEQPESPPPSPPKPTEKPPPNAREIDISYHNADPATWYTDILQFLYYNSNDLHPDTELPPITIRKTVNETTQYTIQAAYSPAAHEITLTQNYNPYYNTFNYITGESRPQIPLPETQQTPIADTIANMAARIARISIAAIPFFPRPIPPITIQEPNAILPNEAKQLLQIGFEYCAAATENPFLRLHNYTKIIHQKAHVPYFPPTIQLPRIARMWPLAPNAISAIHNTHTKRATYTKIPIERCHYRIHLSFSVTDSYIRPSVPTKQRIEQEKQQQQKQKPKFITTIRRPQPLHVQKEKQPQTQPQQPPPPQPKPRPEPQKQPEDHIPPDYIQTTACIIMHVAMPKITAAPAIVDMEIQNDFDETLPITPGLIDIIAADITGHIRLVLAAFPRLEMRNTTSLLIIFNTEDLDPLHIRQIAKALTHQVHIKIQTNTTTAPKRSPSPLMQSIYIRHTSKLRLL